MTEDAQRRHVEAARQVMPEWDAARARRVRAGVTRKHRQFVVLRGTAVAAFVLVLVGAVAFALAPTGGAEVELAAAPTVLEFGDGSRALSEGSDLIVESSTAEEITVRLRRGRSTFEVRKNEARRFVVRAGDVTVTVRGTEFAVEHSDETVRVEVHEGTAQVTSSQGTWTLTQGKHAEFPARREGSSAATGSVHVEGGSQDPVVGTARPEGHGTQDSLSSEAAVDGAGPSGDGAPSAVILPVVEATGDNQTPQVGEPSPAPDRVDADGRKAPDRLAKRKRPSRSDAPSAKGPARSGAPAAEAPAGVTGTDWRELARAGRVKEAAAVLTPAARLQGADELMRAADVMRHAGRSKEAIPYLERVERRHPGSSQAPLAAFHRGRILLRSGGACRAAPVFAKVRTGARRASLREDAHAREVQAWARCGRADKARQLAEQYVARYPSGHFLRAVRKHGGLR